MSLSGNSGSRSQAGSEDYFNMDEILATQEKIPCKFEQPVYNLGYLDPGADTEHIPQGTKLEMPFWLVKSVCSRKKQAVSMELPRSYKEGYREILNADASVVDLHKLGPHYFMFGTHLLQFEMPESADIARALLLAFQNRFRKVMDDSQNSLHMDITQLTSKLDDLERDIFRCGQKGLHDFQRWETRQTEKLTTSKMVLNHRKRKRMEEA